VQILVNSSNVKPPWPRSMRSTISRTRQAGNLNPHLKWMKNQTMVFFPKIVLIYWEKKLF
jgi:hypothetical protein